MSVQELTSFLGWCMVFNFGLMLFWVIAMKTMGDLALRLQQVFVPISREEFDRQMYQFAGQFKVGIILLNLAPYVALRVMY